MAGIWYQRSQLFNTPIYWLLSPIFRRGRCLTTGDLYEMRDGPWWGVLYGVWGVAINIGFLSERCSARGKLIEALTVGFCLRTSVFLMTAAFIFYSLLGGMIATVWNEFFQGMSDDRDVGSADLIPVACGGRDFRIRAAVPGGERLPDDGAREIALLESR